MLVYLVTAEFEVNPGILQLQHSEYILGACRGQLQRFPSGTLLTGTSGNTYH
jgi:hypothetical protein